MTDNHKQSNATPQIEHWEPPNTASGHFLVHHWPIYKERMIDYLRQLDCWSAVGGTRRLSQMRTKADKEVFRYRQILAFDNISMTLPNSARRMLSRKEDPKRDPRVLWGILCDFYEQPMTIEKVSEAVAPSISSNDADASESSNTDDSHSSPSEVEAVSDDAEVHSSDEDNSSSSNANDSPNAVDSPSSLDKVQAASHNAETHSNDGYEPSNDSEGDTLDADGPSGNADLSTNDGDIASNDIVSSDSKDDDTPNADGPSGNTDLSSNDGDIASNDIASSDSKEGIESGDAVALPQNSEDMDDSPQQASRIYFNARDPRFIIGVKFVLYSLTAVILFSQMAATHEWASLYAFLRDDIAVLKVFLGTMAFFILALFSIVIDWAPAVDIAAVVLILFTSMLGRVLRFLLHIGQGVYGYIYDDDVPEYFEYLVLG